MKFLAIGDIHGCEAQLLEILDKAKSYPEYKKVFLGDYIDRGPNSNGVLEIIKNLDAICLLGNHEEMLIHAIESHPDHKEEYLKMANVSEDNLEWLRTLPYIYETDNYIFTHAGLNPKHSLERQTKQDCLWTFYDSGLEHITQKIVVQGHLHKAELFICENHVITDTNCGLGGYLTGVLLPDLKAVRSNTKSPIYNFF